jgi:hypothetical protein
MRFLGGGNKVFPLLPTDGIEKIHYHLPGMIK